MDSDNSKFKGEIVLVVDDEKSVCEPVTEILRHIGFEAHCVTSGSDAVEALTQKPYTFVLTDLKMPDMNGLDLIQIVNDKYPHIVTIAMTGYYMDYSWVDVVNVGATDFINKPFSIGELEAKFKRALNERNTKEALRQLSIKDPVTDLYNQTYFQDRLKAETIRATRQKHPLALIILALDDFNQYIDSHGEPEGDSLLKKVGGAITTKIRQGVDTIYRYDKNKFTIILIETSPQVTKAILERIRVSIKEIYNLGVSLGYAQLSDRMSPEEFIAEAEDRIKNV